MTPTTTTLYVATTGGHLAQLRAFADRIPAGGPQLWVTHENEQSRSLLADRAVEFVPYVGVGDVAGVLRCVPHAHRLWRKHRIGCAVSTGSGIALGYLPYLAARGVACHYIESAARTCGPSRTGRVLRWTPGVAMYSQYDRWARPPWRYNGNWFDGYEAASERRVLGRRLLVVVTVGTAEEFPFRRLFTTLVPLLAPGGPVATALGRPVTVLWQTGGTPVTDLPIHARPFLPETELRAALRAADIVVCHAGTGSMRAALDAGHLPVVAPRLASAGEAGDDHQRELAAELARRGLAMVAEADAITPEDLLGTLGVAVRRTPVLPSFDLVR
ncbi:glycosyltransferase [Haloechinothrix sp. LS1_15]|uniref:glycosyltransferase n=1 Tax=Haloechinothrix sp. LS1_15 TaxID=2652248 RepID=UPI002946D28E|nr:glycosyltransferase [Haloechinothrix sp. LS1_15]MDV6011225.1 glycosyltransferase family 28 [Haloechinothrix sp. LS1_15]